ncbi:hypothetical protein [Candidatus Enterovibrio escicola]|nr:hypothetical protein [Candidatus Enterovibrio escacola]
MISKRLCRSEVKLLADIIQGVKFRDAIRETHVNHQDSSLEAVHQI